jgi:hypothetical protein
MIGKIEKAKRYAQERDRMVFERFEVTMKGDHGIYTVSYNEGKWQCGCHFFAGHGVCSHTMALERILRGMLILEAGEQEAVPAPEAQLG